MGIEADRAGDIADAGPPAIERSNEHVLDMLNDFARSAGSHFGATLWRDCGHCAEAAALAIEAIEDQVRLALIRDMRPGEVLLAVRVEEQRGLVPVKVPEVIMAGLMTEAGHYLLNGGRRP